MKNTFHHLVTEDGNKIIVENRDSDGCHLYNLEALSYDEILNGDVASFYLGNTLNVAEIERLKLEYGNLRLVTTRELFELVLTK